MSLINNLINALEENNIQNFLLNEFTSSTEELFFIKHKLTQVRNKDVTKCEVTIYHDFEKNGKKMRGSSSFFADLSMSLEFLSAKVKEAYTSAASVCNPYFKLPASNSKYGMFTPDEHSNHLSEMNTYENNNLLTAYDIADIIFNNDTKSDAFINSLEIFVEKKSNHILNSNGVDVSFSSTIYSGEYVVQCKLSDDVELYQDFKYSSSDSDIEASLKDQINKNLDMIKDRSVAVPSNTIDSISECKNIILEGSSVYDLFNYYLERLDASMIYTGYSNYQLNDKITDNSNISINIKLTPKTPYSSEGIKHISTNLISDNTIKCITGNARFSHYLGLIPTGTYNSYKLNTGTKSKAEFFKNEPYLRICSFSDFQMNSMTGEFGGEYRLAYYFDGVKEISVTNGSISGDINSILSSIVFSKEKQTS